MFDLKFDNKCYFTFIAASEYEDKLYISDPNNRGLIEYNMSTEETVIKNIFMAENERRNYWSAFTYHDEVWFIPLRDNQKIAIYNIPNNNIKYLPIPKSNHKCEYQPFRENYIVEDKVYLIPAYYDCVLCMDLISKKMERIDIGIYSYSGNIHTTYKSSCMNQNKIYFCPFNNSQVKCYDLINKVVEDIPVLVSSGVYTGIYVKDNILYLMPQKLGNGILKYDLINKAQSVINIGDDCYGNTQYECSFGFNNMVYGLPWNGNIMYEYNCINDEIKARKIGNNNAVYSYYFAQEISKKRFLVTSENKEGPCLIWTDGKVEIINVKLPEDFFIKELLMEIEERQ